MQKQKFLYDAIRILGNGNQGQIYLVEHSETHKLFAMKIIENSLENKEQEKLRQEINALKLLKPLNNENILHLEEVMESKTKTYIITEYCENGTMEEFKEKDLTDFQILQYFKQLLNGFKSLNEKQIIHQDIKPHNILINKDNILKIADFGFSVNQQILSQIESLSESCRMEFSEQVFKKQLHINGTQCFIAPELLDPNIKAFTSRVDI